MIGRVTDEFLPRDWSTVSLKTVVTKLVDGSHNPPSKRESGVPMLSARNILNNQIVFEEYRLISKEDFEREHKRTRISPGDVLLTIVGTIGRSAVVPASARGFALQRSVAVVTPTGVLPKYLMYQFQAPFLQRHFEKNARGTAQKGVYLKTLGQTPILVAPLGQQERIVAEIEKQFSRLDEAVANLKRVKANLKRYKASVLKAAVEGKLTEDWRLSARAEGRRRAQASELETIPKAGKGKWFIYIIECDDGSYYVGHTADLHARWQAHCEGSGADWTRQHPPKYLVHFEECGSREDAVKREKDLKTGFGRTWRKREIDAGRMKPLVHNPANETALPVHGEDMQTGSKLLERILAKRRAKWKGRGKYQEPCTPDISSLPKLPNGWTWARWEQIGFSQNDRPFPSSQYQPSGFKLLRPGNLHASGKVVWTEENTRCMPKKWMDEFPEFVVGPRGLIMNLTAQSLKDEFLGRVCLTGAGEACLLNQRQARLTSVLVVPEFMLWLFKSSIFRRFVDGLNTGSLIQHMFTSQLADFVLPLPPLDEQHQIIAEVERRLSVIEELEAAVEANLTRAERLRQSVLRSAFSGGLVDRNKPTANSDRQSVPTDSVTMSPF